jgi:hypothetical protein
MTQLPREIPQKASTTEQLTEHQPIAVPHESEGQALVAQESVNEQFDNQSDISDNELQNIALNTRKLSAQPLMNPAVQSMLDLKLRSEPTAMNKQPAARIRSQTMGGTEETDMRNLISGIQRPTPFEPSIAPTTFEPPIAADSRPRTDTGASGATMTEMPYTPRGSPATSSNPKPPVTSSSPPVVTSSSPKPPAVPSNTNQHMFRYSESNVVMRTPPRTRISSEKDPGVIRKQLDREPTEFTKNIVIPDPELTSAFPRTPPMKPAPAMLTKVPSPEKKNPQVVVSKDVILRTPQKVSFEPINVPPVLSTPPNETPESLGQRALDQEGARLKQADYLIKKEFRTPLNIQFQYKRIPFLWEKIKQTRRIDELDTAAFYQSLKPLIDQLNWVDTSQPIGTTSVLRREWIIKAQAADAVLQNRPAHLSAERVIDLLRIIAPQRVRVKLQRLRYLEGQRAAAAQQIEDFRVRLIAVKERQRRRKRTQRNPKGSGFKSRVGAMLKKRPKRKRKPSKKRPRKKASVKQEVKKQETVLEPKKLIEIPRSPKIKKTSKTAEKFPDFVRKKKNKKYLN